MSNENYVSIDRDELKRLQADSEELSKIRDEHPFATRLRDVGPQIAAEVDRMMGDVAAYSEDGGEVPEVVGYYSRMRSVLDASGWVNTIGAHKSKESHMYDWQIPVMTVAQHERIVAALESEINALRLQVKKNG